MGVPRIPDWDTLQATDMNPKTGQRNIKNATLCPENYRAGLLKGLRILDEQNAIGRYKWYNLPGDLNGELIERILYYKGNGCFFYIPEENRFYFLPYCLNGTIDVYGRYTQVSPLPFTGKTDTDKEVYLPGLLLTPQNEVLLEEEMTPDIFKNGCVLLYDYCKQYSQTIIPRKDLQEPILGMMADCLPMARTSLMSNSGIRGIYVQDPDQAPIVKRASDSIYEAALTGSPWVPLCSEIKMEELTSAGTALKSEEYLLMMQGIDNYRLSLYGLKNGGLFQKKAHMLEAEQEMNNGNVGLIYQDGLTLRQHFCDIVNSIWNLGIWCEASECVVGIDRNGDMMVGDNQDQSGEIPGEQPEGIQEGGDNNG